MTPYEIPLSPEAQKFSIALAGVTYQLTLRWNTVAGGWVLDIANISNEPVVSGIAVVTGCDLLGQYGYLNFGGQLVAQTDHDLFTPPTYTNLGNEGHIYFVVE
jgi:hypothetical protein